jgi:xyloglucan O-acetyltransferase
MFMCLSLLCSPGPGPPVEVEVEERSSCNYAVGKWVWAPGHARRYNATECNVKESHDCIRNGRPDTGYLDWRWQPADGCPLPAFDAAAFLSAVRGKHVAFVGDSMARNQAQSLICLLSAAFPYRLLYRDSGPGPRKHNFWRYAFPAYDVKVSFYWTPFLLRATGKSEDESVRDNHVHLDALGDRWAADADTIDVAVLAAAHWLLNGAIYYNGSRMVGAHGYPELNVTGVGYAWPLRVAYRAAVDRLSAAGGRPRTVVLATFSPSHFEGKPTNDPTACAKTEPYKDGESDMEWMYREVRDVVYDEANAARARATSGNGSSASATRVEVLDVSKLASMRPDGHPGLYMHDHPFANGAPPEGMYSDCLHFCLPGPVDTFNEILLQILRKRR